MVVKGSCVCGQSTYEYTGEYSAPGVAACHCKSCRKTSGADRSLNLVVPINSVTVSLGAPEKIVTRKGDSGKDVEYHSCGNCGSIMYADPANFPDVLWLKIGLIDDKGFLENLGSPKVHLYAENLWSWEKPTEGADVLKSS